MAAVRCAPPLLRAGCGCCYVLWLQLAVDVVPLVVFGGESDAEPRGNKRRRPMRRATEVSGRASRGRR